MPSFGVPFFLQLAWIHTTSLGSLEPNSNLIPSDTIILAARIHPVQKAMLKEPLRQSPQSLIHLPQLTSLRDTCRCNMIRATPIPLQNCIWKTRKIGEQKLLTTLRMNEQNTGESRERWEVKNILVDTRLCARS